MLSLASPAKKSLTYIKNVSLQSFIYENLQQTYETPAKGLVQVALLGVEEHDLQGDQGPGGLSRGLKS